MDRRFYSAAHFRRVSPPADTPAEIQDRFRAREAGELAIADRVAKFPTLDAGNAQAAIQFQTERYAFHYAALASKTYEVKPTRGTK